MPRKKKTAEMLFELRKDLLNNHLSEVKQYITEWISELAAPSPFIWLESEDAAEFELKQASLPVRIQLLETNPEPMSQWKQWARHTNYQPPKEQSEITNHILRKHFRKRSFWEIHTLWEQKIIMIKDLASPLFIKVEQMTEKYRDHWQITEDFGGTALESSFIHLLKHGQEKSYEQKPAFSRGVWFRNILIEKSAKAEEVKLVAEQHGTIIKELTELDEMNKVVEEWKEVLNYQNKMQEKARIALLKSDFLYKCQFCRKLW